MATVSDLSEPLHAWEEGLISGLSCEDWMDRAVVSWINDGAFKAQPPHGVVLKISLSVDESARPTLQSVVAVLPRIITEGFDQMVRDMDERGQFWTCQDASEKFEGKTYMVMAPNGIRFRCIAEGFARVVRREGSAFRYPPAVEAGLRHEASQPFQPVMRVWMEMVRMLLCNRCIYDWTFSPDGTLKINYESHQSPSRDGLERRRNCCCCNTSNCNYTCVRPGFDTALLVRARECARERRQIQE